MHKRHIPGVSIAIVQDGKVVRAKGYGMANVELSVPATEKTVYQLASVTKTFTAAAIMMLVEEGKLEPGRQDFEAPLRLAESLGKRDRPPIAEPYLRDQELYLGPGFLQDGPEGL